MRRIALPFRAFEDPFWDFECPKYPETLWLTTIFKATKEKWAWATKTEALGCHNLSDQLHQDSDSPWLKSKIAEFFFDKNLGKFFLTLPNSLEFLQILRIYSIKRITKNLKEFSRVKKESTKVFHVFQINTDLIFLISVSVLRTTLI